MLSGEESSGLSLWKMQRVFTANTDQDRPPGLSFRKTIGRGDEYHLTKPRVDRLQNPVFPGYPL
jgi:hypothetical protein